MAFLHFVSGRRQLMNQDTFVNIWLIIMICIMYRTVKIIDFQFNDIYEVIIQVCWPVWNMENKRIYLLILALFQRKRKVNIGLGDVINRNSELKVIIKR